MRKNYLIEVNNLHKNYFFSTFGLSSFFLNRNLKEKKALTNINLKINFGEKVAFLGKNGSGKSTLLKIISRVTAPSMGEVILRGKVVSMLEAGLGFHSDLTGRENILINASILGGTKKEISKIIPLIFEFAELDGYIDMQIKKYSSGMEAKLGSSMAIYLNSDVLIVDELLSVVDGKFRNKWVKKINSISFETNKAIIFVSHNMDLVSRICDRGIILDKGKIIYDGKIREAILFYNKKILHK